MVHNGIEYGMMAAYAEGLGVLKSANIGKHTHDIDAEDYPVAGSRALHVRLHLAEVTEVWRRAASLHRGCSTSPRPR